MIRGLAQFQIRDAAGNVVPVETPINIDEAPTGTATFDRPTIPQIGGEAIVTVATSDPEGGPVEILNPTFTHGTIETVSPGVFRVRTA